MVEPFTELLYVLSFATSGVDCTRCMMLRPCRFCYLVNGYRMMPVPQAVDDVKYAVPYWPETSADRAQQTSSQYQPTHVQFHMTLSHIGDSPKSLITYTS
jgi:hypothetical protein